jgi:AraC-like DNA-binding protein
MPGRLGWMEAHFKTHLDLPAGWDGRNDQLTVNVVLAGRGVCYSQGTKAPLSPGCLFLGAPGRRVRCEYLPPGTYREFILVVDRFTAAELQRAGLLVGRPSLCEAKLADWMPRQIAGIWDDLGEGESALPTGSLLTGLVGFIEQWQQVARRDRRPDPTARAVDRACALLASPRHGDTPIRQIAGLVELAYPTFRRAFARRTGMSAREYRIRVRLGRACDLLPTRSVREVADALGYCDPYSFSRQFRRYMGLPPSRLTVDPGGEGTETAPRNRPAGPAGGGTDPS